MLRKVTKISGIVFIFLFTLVYFYWILPFWGIPFNAQRHGQLPLTPSWALECWLWEDDINTAEYVDELLEGYKRHDLPVRTILIDSPWSLRYNDFKVDISRYPDPEKWFQRLQDDGYRVVLWMTPNVNSYSKDTKIKNSQDWSGKAIDQGYLAGNDDQNRWWKGVGGFIDYTNTDAMRWWRDLQQTVFDYGIDGWKLDGSATLFSSSLFGVPIPYKSTSDGIMSTRTYMDHYYRDEYQHGLKQNPEFVTLSRSIDRKYIHPEGFSPFDASPVNWVGDQRHTWKSGENKLDIETDNDLVMEGIEGIEMAIEHILESARVGYNIIGSDVAGFSGKDIPPRLYIRWAQFSTFCGLFLNGGHGDRRLWKRSKEEMKIIRKFSWLHTELIPYMYHYVVSAHNDGRRLQLPIDDGTYQYMFGDDLLIAPIFVDSKTRNVTLPEGNWRYFFNDIEIINGNKSFDKEYSLDEFPVFIKEGAIIPMNISRSYTNIGDSSSEGFTTIQIYPNGQNRFVFNHLDSEEETVISYVLKESNISIHLEGKHISHILHIKAKSIPKIVELDDQLLEMERDWNYDKVKERIIIKTSIYDQGNYKISY